MAGAPQYLAYLVRLWSTRRDGERVWRASVEDAHSGERRAFADLASLFDFLREVTGVLSDTQGDESDAAMPDDTQDG